MKNRDNKALNKLSDWFPFDGFFNLRQKLKMLPSSKN